MTGTLGRTKSIAVAVLALAAAAAPAHAAARSARPAVPPAHAAAGYRSPGYMGKMHIGSVVAPPLPPITLGTGKYPNLLVDAAGNAHVVYTQDGGESAADTIFSCTLQRGSKTCLQAQTVPAPVFPTAAEGGNTFEGNFPAGDHDYAGAIPLSIGNNLFIVENRFPDVFNTPDGMTSESNVFLWSSNDGGQTITGPGQIGTDQLGGGAAVYGTAADPAIGTISATETGGTFFQGTPAGQFTSAQAQLGTGDQAYYGSVADDPAGGQGLPIAAFADLSGNVFVREWSGQGDVNDASTWSTASFAGYSPQIVAGASGVFVLYSQSTLGGAPLMLQRILAGRPSAAPVQIAAAASQESIAEDASGELSIAYVDTTGIEVRTSNDGTTFSPPQLTAAIPSGATIAHLVTSVTADGGGFVAYVNNPTGAEAIGQITLNAFGTQQATGKPGLGTLPGGGVGSSVGDQLATSTCTSATFGVVDAVIKAGCFAHDPQDPNLDVSLGEVDINGLRLIPDAGVRIGIDPRQHTIDTTGSVSVVLTGGGLNITIFHGSLDVKLPTAGVGDDLFDFKELTAPLIAGFPVDGDIDVKLVDGGVQIPVSLKLPDYFGGVTGAADLMVSQASGLQLTSLNFSIGDADFGGLELKDVAVSYTQTGDVWKGMATIDVPSGGGVFSADVAVEFDNGDFTSGSLDIGLPYPGIPLDDTDTPPQLYLTHGGLGLGLNPLTLTGTVGFGLTPLAAPGTGGLRDYAFSLDGSMSVAFGNPVTITATATGYLYTLQIANAKLVYKIPDQVTLTGSSSFNLGLIQINGLLSAIIDPKHDVFGGHIESDIVIDTSKLDIPGLGDITIPSEDIAVNNRGFAVYVPVGQIPFFFGTITYDWGDTLPNVIFGSDVVDRYTAGLPAVSSDLARAHAAAASTFTVTPGAPSASLIVTGAGGAPSVVLTSPSGQQITPASSGGPGVTAVAFPQASGSTTDVGIVKPAPGRWTVSEAPGSTVPISGVQYALGMAAPTVHAQLSGSGAKRTITYMASLPDGTAVSFAEEDAAGLLHVIGTATGKHGTIHFTPAPTPAGRRQVVALITDNGLPHGQVAVGSFVVPPPPKPAKADGLKLQAHRHSFAIHLTPGANWTRTLIQVRASDGRQLTRIVATNRRSLSVAVIGFEDAITVTVRGIGTGGVRGPALTAHATTAKPPLKKQPHRHKR